MTLVDDQTDCAVSQVSVGIADLFVTKVDAFEQWSGTFRLYCWTKGWLILAEPQSNIENLVVSDAETVWTCSREMVHEAEMCARVLGAVFMCMILPRITRLVVRKCECESKVLRCWMCEDSVTNSP